MGQGEVNVASGVGALWVSLASIGVLGFSLGPQLTPNIPATQHLMLSLGSSGLATMVAVEMVVLGLVGGLVSRRPRLGGAAAVIGVAAVLVYGVYLTLTELPNLITGTQLSPAELQAVASAIALTQIVGGTPMALLAGFVAAVTGMLLERMEKVPLAAIAPAIQQGPQPGPQAPAVATVESQAAPSTSVPPRGKALPDISESDTGPLTTPPPCPRCGTRLKWMKQKRRYYCAVCNVFP